MLNIKKERSEYEERKRKHKEAIPQLTKELIEEVFPDMFSN